MGIELMERLGKWNGIEVYKTSLQDYLDSNQEGLIYVIENDLYKMVYNGSVIGTLKGNTVHENERRERYVPPVKEKKKEPPKPIKGQEDIDSFFAQLNAEVDGILAKATNITF